MGHSEIWIRAEDGAELFSRRWMPDSGAPRAVVQVVHGLAEHSLRYETLASRLCGAGFEVWADDHRGHGATARGGSLGHVADRGSFDRVISDLSLWTDEIRSARPDLPIFLLGHSWGAFLAQGYIERAGSCFAGCVLSGARGPGGLDVPLGAFVASILTFFTGPRRYSPLLHMLADGKLNAQFSPARTPFDWVSRDVAAVDAYIADPLCGFKLSGGFYRDLALGLLAAHRKDAIARIPKDLQIYVVTGAADPVTMNGKSSAALVEAYRAAGIADLEYAVYPDARHEIFNETNRGETVGALVSWLERHLPPAA